MVSNLSVKWSLGCLTAALILSACGCAGLRGRVPANEYSIPDVSAEVGGEFGQVRDVVRDVLRESPVEIYTRDKRGAFVVFADMGRAFLTPRRLRLVFTLERMSESNTRVTVPRSVHGPASDVSRVASRRVRRQFACERDRQLH
jgi:outer membrane lipopolysaccharide assembly protein LptE/RlpB